LDNIGILYFDIVGLFSAKASARSAKDKRVCFAGNNEENAKHNKR
jgi:hypothetical protein